MLIQEHLLVVILEMYSVALYRAEQTDISLTLCVGMPITSPLDVNVSHITVQKNVMKRVVLGKIPLNSLKL